MLNFDNELTNEDVLKDSESVAALRVWYVAAALVLGNLPGLFLPSKRAYDFRLYMYFNILLGSVLVSMGYHICQSVNYCFLWTLPMWTSLDHITATLVMVARFLFLMNMRSRAQIERETRRPLPYDQENMLYDSWSVGSTYWLFLLVVVAVFAHPFSMQAFNIVLAGCIAALFFKLVVLDRAKAKNFRGRVSWPELFIFLTLTTIGLVFYVTCSFTEYWLLHTLWHIFIYISEDFFIVALSRNTPYWYSTYAIIVSFFFPPRTTT
jgi:hypothetical protein